MAKVTSKLQVTLPKALATQYRIRAGDEILWVASGDAIRVVPARDVSQKDAVAERLELFDAATERHRRRYKKQKPKRVRHPAIERGWTRAELYDRGRSR
jgi:bifunctional DNA-binding transcriptional regulator/antitoxin component of YhaV-PrlF toxin-antitoxin module